MSIDHEAMYDVVVPLVDMANLAIQVQICFLRSCIGPFPNIGHARLRESKVQCEYVNFVIPLPL